MANSNTPLSKAQRALSSAKTIKEKIQKGEYVRVNVYLSGFAHVELWNKLKISKVDFIKSALKNLDEHGNLK